MFIHVSCLFALTFGFHSVCSIQVINPSALVGMFRKRGNSLPPTDPIWDGMPTGRFARENRLSCPPEHRRRLFLTSARTREQTKFFVNRPVESKTRTYHRRSPQSWIILYTGYIMLSILIIYIYYSYIIIYRIINYH